MMSDDICQRKTKSLNSSVTFWTVATEPAARGEEVHVTVENGTYGTNGTAQKLRLLRGLSTELPLPKGLGRFRFGRFGAVL